MLSTKEIFISHSSENKNIAEQLSAFFSHIGVKPSDIFCSSIVGQGMDDDEKLSQRICASLSRAKIIVYMLSYNFLSSAYCMEELGVGWYLSQKGKTSCFFIVLPDIELSNLYGFVNAKIDKFIFLDEEHRDDIGLMAENICDKLHIKLPRHSLQVNFENTYFSATKSMNNDLIVNRDQRQKEKQDHDDLIHLLQKQLAEKEARIDAFINEQNENQKQIDQIKQEVELRTIEERFIYLGFGSGVSKALYKAASKSFWFEMVNRWLDLQAKLDTESCKSYMYMLLATIYSADGNMEKAYSNIVKYTQLSDGVISFYIFENFLLNYTGSMQEVIDALHEKLLREREGLCRDSYLETIAELEKREQNIIGGLQ